jgi:hypothetical protein
MKDDPVASNINWLAIVIQTRCVNCEVEIESLRAYVILYIIKFISCF